MFGGLPVIFDRPAVLPKTLLALHAESNNSAFISNDILYPTLKDQLYAKGQTPSKYQ